MSQHHQRMLQRYGLGPPGDMYSVVNCDPIFTPLFSAFWSLPVFGLSATAAGIAGSITTAISAGGGYMEFKI